VDCEPYYRKSLPRESHHIRPDYTGCCEVHQNHSQRHYMDRRDSPFRGIFIDGFQGLYVAQSDTPLPRTSFSVLKPTLTSVFGFRVCIRLKVSNVVCGGCILGITNVHLTESTWADSLRDDKAIHIIILGLTIEVSVSTLYRSIVAILPILYLP